MLQSRLVSTQAISVCGSLVLVNRVSPESENCVNCLVAKLWIYSQRELKMDKLSKTYDDFFKQVMPESPLKEAFRKWNETTKQIEKNNAEKVQ